MLLLGRVILYGEVPYSRRKALITNIDQGFDAFIKRIPRAAVFNVTDDCKA